ncbi:GCN5-related N-acetyltransferase [Candidatus Moduliflexus flocculans]|uniref:GCN5-related N-acetyltransferase n=1 Tax=Candidatus Moduliflexus flocculans TaxID=1499966 RepID=A0A081BM41_9BACT|nr:GCN5-related N-acetyltransferase [Candidatus Moduliflexus flocculans]
MENILKRTDSTHADFQQLVGLLDAELRELYGQKQENYTALNIVDRIPVVLCYREQTPIGCAGIKEVNALEMEVKRVFVRPDYRGQGLSKILMQDVEQWARELGKTALILETGKKQIAAISLYQTLGYHVIENYGAYVGNDNSICMKKML